MPTILILMGAPGAGKGTQANRMSQILSLPHISTGDLFRANLKEMSAVGSKAKGFMDAGQLVPDAVVLEMLFDRVAEPDCSEGYLLDGFPRTLPQADALGTALEAKGLGDAVVVMNLEVADQTIIKRAGGRLLCRTCANIQHLEFSPPKTAGICDADGGELYQREDDSAAVVRERLHVYHEQTEPLVKYYGDRDVLTAIDGEQAPDVVFSALEKALQVRS